MQNFYPRDLPYHADTPDSFTNKQKKVVQLVTDGTTDLVWKRRKHCDRKRYTKDLSTTTSRRTSPFGYRLARSPYAHICFIRVHAHALTDTEIITYNKILCALYNCLLGPFVIRVPWHVLGLDDDDDDDGQMPSFRFTYVFAMIFDPD